MNMPYGLNDVKQSALGAIIASLLVVIIRAGQPLTIDATKGFIIGIIWIFIVTKPFVNGKLETKIHAFWNVVVTLIITTVLSISFDLMMMEQLTIAEFTGSAAWIIMLIALPTAIFFDKKNIINHYDRWYLRRSR